jgi:hypothetical protein
MMIGMDMEKGIEAIFSLFMMDGADGIDQSQQMNADRGQGV